jgi:hypothetical protein
VNDSYRHLCDRPQLAGSSPMTLITQCRVKSSEQPVGGPVPGSAPDPSLTLAEAGSGL